ncbi:MAG: DNA topoisomerase, partial [Lachnospiraceae bacterium]|nr:DNA topoisomerase [Lachnospiraceae bacterium]
MAKKKVKEIEEQIIRTEFSDIMKKSFIDYSMSVIISRAIPDVRDGLKPVQRRTLYDMHELGIRHDSPYRKCARIVGDTMGKYHPHGDSSIYEALVVMAQDFKKGMTLVDGHGNFGSIEGDGAAAMRYTEARLEKFTQTCFLADL